MFIKVPVDGSLTHYGVDATFAPPADGVHVLVGVQGGDAAVLAVAELRDQGAPAVVVVCGDFAWRRKWHRGRRFKFYCCSDLYPAKRTNWK